MDSAAPDATPSCPGKTFRIYNIQEVLASFPAHPVGKHELREVKKINGLLMYS
jgi:hypothetical protein